MKEAVEQLLEVARGLRASGKRLVANCFLDEDVAYICTAPGEIEDAVKGLTLPPERTERWQNVHLSADKRSQVDRLPVPGGWLYREWNLSRGAKEASVNVVFVPYR
jgi:hypothetical protein